MKLRSVIIYLNFAYASALFFFIILFYFKIKIIFLTNFIIFLLFFSLIFKFSHWYSVIKIIREIKNNEKKISYLLRLIFSVITYISPVYCIIQEPNLVVSHYVSTITFTIVTVLAIIGIFIERWLFIIESQQTVYDNNAESI